MPPILLLSCAPARDGREQTAPPDTGAADSAPDSAPSDSGTPAADPCVGHDLVDLYLTFADYLTDERLPDLTVEVCGETWLTDAEGGATVQVPLSALVTADVTGSDDYPPYRFVLDIPDAADWADLEDYAGGTVWLPKVIIGTRAGTALLTSLGFERDEAMGGAFFAIGPDTYHRPAVESAEGAQASLAGVAYESSITQVGTLSFEEGDTLGVDDGEVYFVNVEPGTATLCVVNAAGEPCQILPSFASTCDWEAEVEPGVELVAGFQCPA